jgi:hypothetical protein
MATLYAKIGSTAETLHARLLRRRGVAIAAAAVCLLALAAVRTYVVFVLSPADNNMYSESLVRFRYAEMVMEGEALPASDPAVQWPEGFRRDEMIMALPDLMAGWSYRAWAAAAGAPDHYVYLRYFMAVYAATYVPAGFLLFWVMFRRFWPAFGATALYVLCLPTYLRAAGNYLREDFATPALLAATAWAWIFLERPPARPRPRAALVAALALSVLYALSCWHMAQFYLNVVLGVVFLSALAGRPGRYGDAGAAFLLGTAAAALLNEPLLAKGVLWSPTVAAAVALAVWGLWPQPPERRRRWILVAAAGALVAASLVAVGSGAYGHAYALIVSKLRYAGVHPDDPTKLPLDARIFWMGPYATTTLKRALLEYGPLLVAAVAAFAWICGRRLARRPGAGGLALFGAVMTAATAVLYWLIVRLTIFFSPWAAALGVLPAVRARRRWAKIAGAVLVVGLIAFEFYWAFNVSRPTLPRRVLEFLVEEDDPLWDYGERDNDVFFWLRDNTPAGSPVLAQFGVSASIMYWGERPVALHPMFEVPEIRPKIVRVSRAYMGSEDNLYELCRRWRIAYVVFNAPVFLVYEPPGDRYFAAAPDPPADAVGMKMQFAPAALRLFRLVHETYSFRVFEVGAPYDGYEAKRYHPYFDANVFDALPTRERYLAVSRDIRRAGVHYGRALALEEAERWSSAAAEYGLALSLHPDYDDAEMRLGYCLVRLERYREAEPHFRRALRVDPENPQAHTYMGSYYFSTGAYAAALAEYRRAHELDPDDPAHLERILLVEKAMAGG